MGWDRLENRYRAIVLAVVVVLGGASILVAIAMTFNWHLHRASVEEFMAKEAGEHQKLIAEHEVDCPALKGDTHYVILTEEEIALRNTARVKRVEFIRHASEALGAEWEEPDVRRFIMYGEPLE